MTEAPVKPWVTQTRAIGSVTAPIVSTVALLIALFAIEAFWTAILAQLSADPRWTPTVSIDRITTGTILTFTGKGAVFTKMSFGACLITDDACPSIGAITAIFQWITFSSTRAIITCQAAVMAKSVIQTHKFLFQITLGSKLPLIIFIVVIALQGLAVIVQQSELWQRQLNGTCARQSLNRIFKGKARESVLVQTETPAAVALEGTGVVLARVITTTIHCQTFIYIITATPV